MDGPSYGKKIYMAMKRIVFIALRDGVNLPRLFWDHEVDDGAHPILLVEVLS